jgi:hypothetical protein
MTIKQKEKVDILFKEHQERCAMYSGIGNQDDCSFDIFVNNSNENDKNVTIYLSFVSGLSDDFQPFYDVMDILVEESGDTIELSKVLSPMEKKDYLSSLTKIN